jgi:hypothetical protein
LTLPFVGAAANGNGATYFGYIFGAAKPEDNNYYVPSALKAVTLTGSGAVADSAFAGCTWLESLTLSSISSIGASSFAGCTGLKTLNLADNGALATIGESAFSGCTSLLSLTIPENMTNIGAFAFADCTALSSVFFNAKTMEDLNANVFSAAGTAGEGIAVTIGAGVTRVPAKLIFRDSNGNRANVSSITFAVGSVCTEIGQSAFEFCKETTLVLPQGLQSIGSAAFFGNDLLRSVSIPASVTIVDDSAFDCCYGLSRVEYRGTKAEWLAVRRGAWWITAPSYTVVCEDGELIKG